MFIGHFAVAFGAKKVAPKVSLGTLVLASQFIDLLWPLFLLLGIEHVHIEPGNTAFTPLNFYDYPITHSLVGVTLWSFLLGGIYFAVRRDAASSLVVAFVVASHWILDFITHRPDLPLGFNNATHVGLGLWNSIPATLVIEIILFIAGVTLYLRTTTAKDNIGKFGLWSLIIFMMIIYVGNVFGPPPPSEHVIALAGNLGWLFVL